MTPIRLEWDGVLYILQRNEPYTEELEETGQCEKLGTLELVFYQTKLPSSKLPRYIFAYTPGKRGYWFKGVSQ